MNETLSVIMGIGGAATLAGYLVSFFKMARPTASPGAIMAVAFLSGQAMSVLAVAASNGLALSQQVIAGIIGAGIIASAAAAGLSSTNQRAEEKRLGPDVQAQRELVAKTGAQAEKENK